MDPWDVPGFLGSGLVRTVPGNLLLMIEILHYFIFLIMGNVGFVSSTVVSSYEAG